MFHHPPGAVAPVSVRHIRIDASETVLFGELIEYPKKEGQ
jgi:hypothetical protein